MANETKWTKMTQCIVVKKKGGGGSGSHIDCLSDELLMEILRRLPDCKNVTQCKCVCKLWDTLTSSPWFITRFIDLNFERQTFGIITWYEPNRHRSLWKGSESFFRPSIFLSAENSSFSSLPFPGGYNDTSVNLVASCKDLLLYSRHERDKKYDSYMSNVQTKQWIELPSPPIYYGRLLHFGLICNPRGLYCVVVICCTPPQSTKFIAHLFSSTTNQWCDRVLSLPKICTVFEPCMGVCFDGKLHFMCREGIFGFDPINGIEFDDEIKCHFIEWPIANFSFPFCYRVGYSQESLQASLVQSGPRLLVWVWVLETNNWMLQYQIETSESWISKEVEKFSQEYKVDVLGFHPSSPGVIYVLVPGYIFICNLSTKTAKLACRILDAVSQRRESYLYRPHCIPVLLQS